AVSAFPVQRHNDFRRELPGHSHVGEAWIHGRYRVLAAWRIETELNKRQKLVERLVLRWTASKTVGQVVGTVLKGPTPVQCFDVGNEGALKSAARCVDAKGSGCRAERQFVDERTCDGEGS